MKHEFDFLASCAHHSPFGRNALRRSEDRVARFDFRREPRPAHVQKVAAAGRAPNQIIDNKESRYADDSTCASRSASTTWRRTWRRHWNDSERWARENRGRKSRCNQDCRNLFLHYALHKTETLVRSFSGRTLSASLWLAMKCAA